MMNALAQEYEEEQLCPVIEQITEQQLTVAVWEVENLEDPQ
jgi:hypothetical protein